MLSTSRPQAEMLGSDKKVRGSNPIKLNYMAPVDLAWMANVNHVPRKLC